MTLKIESTKTEYYTVQNCTLEDKRVLFYMPNTATPYKSVNFDDTKEITLFFEGIKTVLYKEPKKPQKTQRRKKETNDTKESNDTNA